MPEQRRIIFDLSTSARWRGPGAAGIVQTERELARFAPEVAGAPVVFALYNMHHKRYFTIRPPLVSKILDGRARVEFRGDRTAAEPSLTARVRWVARNPRKYLRRKLHRFGLADESLDPRERSTGTEAAQQVVPFVDAVSEATVCASSDVLISCGADWHEKDLVAILRDKERAGFSYVSMCYDIIPWRFPHFWPAGVAESVIAHHADAAWVADLVMCISQTTAHEYRTFCESVEVPCPPIGVFRLGDSTAPTTVSRSRLPRGLEEDTAFILMVGSIEPRKNHRLVYDVFDDLSRSGALSSVRLVFVGAGQWMTDDLLREIDLNPAVNERILVLGAVDDAQLHALYERCLFTLYPSLNEGWGLPVVESLSHGKVCLASNRGSLPEISSLPVLIDPHDFHAWRKAIHKYATDSEARSALEARIREGFEPHGWRQSAGQFFEIVTDSLAG